MKAAQISKYGDSTNIIITNSASKPEPKDDQILVRVKAAGINPFDNMVLSGAVADAMPLTFPATLGMDFAGVVEAVGENVTDYKPSERVFGQAKMFAGFGAFAEYTITLSKSIARVPDNIDDEHAAAAPLTAVSAYQVIHKQMHLQKNQKVLIHGGGGGIGNLAIQMAKGLGAYVATTAGPDEQKFVKQLGADESFDYTSQRFEEHLENYDAVFDTVGGETYTRSFKVLKPSGIIVSMLEQPNNDLTTRYKVRSVYQLTHVNHQDLQEIARLLQHGSLRINIDKIFPIDKTAAAMEHLKTGHPKGKVVVRIDK